MPLGNFKLSTPLFGEVDESWRALNDEKGTYIRLEKGFNCSFGEIFVPRNHDDFLFLRDIAVDYDQEKLEITIVIN